MNKWGEEAKWFFGEEVNCKYGINDAGIGIFKKKPYVGLAKEILQNSLDAKDPNKNGPVKVKFEMTSIKADSFPGKERMLDVIKKCYATYGTGVDGEKLLDIKNAAEKFLNNNIDIPVLKIGDYNTTGLTGVKEEQGSNWTGLIIENGASNKGNGNSGAFGIGKFAPFNFSSIRTIIYSTLNCDNEIAIQGKTILTSFKEDGTYKGHIGLFGVNKIEPFYDYNLVPDIFRRTEFGTDLFILAVDKDKEDYQWYHQVVICILDSFFYAINQGLLEVEVIDGKTQIKISKDNLGETIELYDGYCKENGIEFSVLDFWNVLINKSGKAKKYTTQIESKGEVELYLLVDPENIDERKVVEMRKAGMKICEDIKFKIPTHFYGIFIATGNKSKSDSPEDNISSFLRRCENPAHDTWSEGEYDGHQDEAEKILGKIHKWILEKVKENMPEIKEDTVSAYGLSELLPNQISAGNEVSQQDAFINFRPKPLVIADTKSKKDKQKSADISKNIKKKKKIINPEDIIVTTRMRKIRLLGVKTPYDMKDNKYIISFSTQENCNNLHLKIKMAADDDDKRNAVIKNATLNNGGNLKIEDGHIILPSIDKSQKNIIKVELEDSGKFLLEVEAYA